jgi:hypothetical protein
MPWAKLDICWHCFLFGIYLSTFLPTFASLATF